VSLGITVEDAVELADGHLLRQTLGQAINLSIVAGADLVPAQVDANQLELAILNLAINARDAMADGGSLRIGLQNRKTDSASPPELRPGEYAVISLADSGTGMDEATSARAFDPLFTTKEQGAGSGLGLSATSKFPTVICVIGTLDRPYYWFSCSL
jgi:signal transduction histidine kinase